MICRKCNTTGTLVIRKAYIYCDNCFITNINHKFRACIGKNTKLTKNEKALICLSGGISSTVLLDLIMNGVALSTHKKLRIIPEFLHITGFDAEDDSSNAIRNLCKGYNANLHIVNVSEFNVENNDYEAFKIHSYLGKLSPTTRHDYLAKLKQRIFYKMAKDSGCNIVFTGENNTKLSEKLLSNIVLGQGPHIENDVGFCDARDCNTKIFRPMKDITKEELHQYSRIKHLNAVSSIDKTETCSLQSIINKFILDLEESTPATISTICKTADKIGSEEEKICNMNCSVCKSTIDTKPKKLSAVDAIVYSKMVSTGHIMEGDLSYNCVFPQLYETLCYSCSKNYTELKL